MTTGIVCNNAGLGRSSQWNYVGFAGDGMIVRMRRQCYMYHSYHTLSCRAWVTPLQSCRESEQAEDNSPQTGINLSYHTLVRYLDRACLRSYDKADTFECASVVMTG